METQSLANDRHPKPDVPIGSPNCTGERGQLSTIDLNRTADNRAAELDSTSPSALLSDAGLDSFISHAGSMLRRHVPDFMFECAEEAAEDAALAVRKDPSKFRSMAGVYGYAFTVLKHRAEHVRDIYSVEVNLDADWDGGIDDDPLQVNLDPESALIQKETLLIWRHELQWALGHLKAKLRSIVQLYDLEELSCEKISTLVGIKKRTLYNRHSEAFQQLRLLLSPDLLTC